MAITQAHVQVPSALAGFVEEVTLKAGCKRGLPGEEKEKITGKESMRREDLRNLKDLERVPIARVPLDCLGTILN